MVLSIAFLFRTKTENPIAEDLKNEIAISTEKSLPRMTKEKYKSPKSKVYCIFFRRL
jgi:hypothetical protein